MKVHTVFLPTALFIGLGIQHHDTRRWRTKYRGPLVIHIPIRCYPVGCWQRLIKQPNRDILIKLGYLRYNPVYDTIERTQQKMPERCLYAIADLVAVEALTDAVRDQLDPFQRSLLPFPSPGHFLWTFETPILIEPPVTFTIDSKARFKERVMLRPYENSLLPDRYHKRLE